MACEYKNRIENYTLDHEPYLFKKLLRRFFFGYIIMMLHTHICTYSYTNRYNTHKLVAALCFIRLAISVAK